MSTSPKVPFRQRIGEIRSDSPHLCDMDRYSSHASRNSRAIAVLLHKLYGATHARRVFENSCPDQIRDYEKTEWDELATFMGLDDSQRSDYLLELPDERTQICFMVLAIHGATRAAHFLTLRDKYREVLAPVRGLREITCAVYELTAELSSSYEYDWPEKVFAECGISEQAQQRPRHLKLVQKAEWRRSDEALKGPH
jgi:hypothetical protein